MIKRLLLSLAALAPVVLWVASPSGVVAAEEYVEGTHYELISPAVRTADSEKIEVAEFIFFWTWCF